MRIALSFFIVTLLFSVVIVSGAEPTTGPVVDAKDLIARGEKSKQKLGTQPSRWSATIYPGAPGVSVTAEWTAAPPAASVVLTLHVKQQSQQLARIIQRDGSWYVTEQDRSIKCRPFEFPFRLPDLLLFYQYSLPRPMPELPADAQLESSDGTTAEYRIPVQPQVRAQLQSMLKQYDTAEPAVRAGNPQLQETITKVRDLVDHGMLMRVDLASGMLTELTNPKMRIVWSAPKWLDAPDASAMDVSAQTWQDHTTYAANANLDDLVMMDHEGSWTPGSKGGDMDARLVNTRTGEFWRVPFEGSISIAGCFLRDRSQVIVSGSDQETGFLSLYSIDLKTGQNRRVGDAAVASGFNLFPAVSHDGKQLAFLHKGATEQVLEGQVMLVDLQTHRSRPLGKAMDTAFLSWLPDDSGLILITRHYADMTKTGDTHVARMDLSGNVNELCPGDSPLVLPTGRILFEDRPTKDQWNTCALDGSDIQPLGDGLAHFGFPTVSPDGKHLLMMHFTGNRQIPPAPTLFDIDGTHPKELTVDRGLWSSPAW